MSKTEHILLESDHREVPELRTARRLHARTRIRSRLRRRAVELDIIDYYYLSVRVHGPRSAVFAYVLDLRFVDPSLRHSRHVAWRWMLITLAFAALTAVSMWWIGSSAAQGWQPDQLRVCATMLALTACTGLVSVYRTTETLRLYSAHGQARFLEFTGGLGTLRAARPFALKLAAHIRIASTARRASRTQHLRDEMREHFRLKEARVLSSDEYEESKARILAKHARA